MRISLVVCLLLSWSGHARAQDVPYVNYLVGDRALGLGGAFVGLAEDGSATFHNPAGLSLVPENAVSTSFWVAGLQHRKLDGGWSTDGGTADFSDTGLTFPPLVFTAVTKVGEPDDNGQHTHSVGVAILKPLRQDYRFAHVDEAGNQLSTMDLVHRDNARWYGVSYALRLPYRVSVGMSAFLAIRDLSHEEIEAHGQNGPPQPTPESHVLSRHYLLEATLRDLIWRFGATWDPNPCWRIGVMFQLPGISMRSSASIRQFTLDLDPNGVMTAETVARDDLRPWRPVPWELRAGVTRFLGERGLMTFDVAMHGGAGSEPSPVLLIRQNDIPRPSMMSTSSFMRPSLRLAVGGEYVYRKRFPLRGGIMYYGSGLPDVPEQSDVPFVSDMRTLGASLSGGLLISDHQVSVGTAIVHAWGTGSALDQSGVGPARYRAADASETTMLVFISGAIGGAKALMERGGRWLEEQQEAQ